jgi:hypothetical protein
MEVLSVYNWYVIVSDWRESGELEDVEWFWGAKGWEQPRKGDAALDNPNAAVGFNTRGEAEKAMISLPPVPKG